MAEILKTHTPLRRISIIKSAVVKKNTQAIESSPENFFPIDAETVAVDNAQNDIAHFTEKRHEEYERGFAEARVQLESEMIARGEQKVAQLSQNFEKLEQNFSKEFNLFRNKIEMMIPKLSIAIAEKIIKQQVVASDVIIVQIREAVRRVVGVEKIRIRLNPLDETTIREHRGTITSGADSVRDIIIEVDEKIEQGGCIIESEMGNVDARISTQLKQIEDVFREQVAAKE